MKDIPLMEMKSQLIELSKVKSVGRVLKGSAFKRIPSVKEWKLEKRDNNQILAALDIHLKVPSVPKVVLNESESMNRYMKFTLLRLRKMVNQNDYKNAWRLVVRNILFSASFRISAINSVASGWYFSIASSEVYKVNRKVQRLLSLNPKHLDFKRVYITKANGKLRPLGVPTLEWRIVLHLWNGFIQEVMSKFITDSQHAYLPGRGVMSAWKKIIEYSRKYEYIYETDLKGFFDNVSVHRIMDLLQAASCPKQVRNFIWTLCESCPNIKDDLLDERKYNKDTAFFYGNLDPEWRDLFIKKKKMLASWESFNYMEYTDMFKNMFFERKYKYRIPVSGETELRLLNYGVLPGGVPQGMPLSPFLSILALPIYLHQNDNIQVVNYADDQVFFSHTPFTIKDLPHYGIIHNEEKSGWIKFAGKWNTSLKFLGYRIDEDGNLVSETRSGTKGKLPSSFLNIFNESSLSEIEKSNSLKEIQEVVFKQFSGETFKSLLNLSKKKIFGFALSCLNLNNWSNDLGPVFHARGIRNLIGKVHKKAFIARCPSNLTSSFAIEVLSSVVRREMYASKKSLLKQLKKRKGA